MCVSMSHISALCVHIIMHTIYMYAHVCKCVVHLYAYHVNVFVCAIVSTNVSQCMLYQCVQTYTYKWRTFIRWNQLLLPAGRQATMRQDCPFGAFPPFVVPPTGCCWGIQRSYHPRAQTSQTLLPRHLLLPLTHWCSTGKISPARLLELKRSLKNCLYHQGSASQSWRTSHCLELLLHFPLLHHHFLLHLKLCPLLHAHSVGSFPRYWPQLCLFQMNPASHWLWLLLSWPPLPLQPGNVQNSEQLLPHSQTLPKLWCCPEHT